MEMLREYEMGIGMQMIFLGFARSFLVEAEASVQLLRLERFGKRIAGCNLTIEALLVRFGQQDYDARLDLIGRDGQIVLGPRWSDEEPNAAIRKAFDAAEKSLSSGSNSGLGSDAALPLNHKDR
jgi:hypothetical protein